MNVETSRHLLVEEWRAFIGMRPLIGKTARFAPQPISVGFFQRHLHL